MQIDVTKLLQNITSVIHINDNVSIPKEMLNNSLIDDLKDIKINADARVDEENNIILTGKLEGTMILKDDITLEPVSHNFHTEIEEILDKNENILDITDVLWQNILVEIPSKVRATSEDIELSGDGWRVISEDKFNEEINKGNNPFSNLEEIIFTKEEK